MTIEDIVDLKRFPLAEDTFGTSCAETLDDKGVLVLQDFIRPAALEVMRAESSAKQSEAYFCTSKHSVYLTPHDPAFPADHPANILVESSKGCICDDIVAQNSPLRTLYNDTTFRNFIKLTTREAELHSYADPLSSINVHYAKRGQELGWHFDNSSFAITLLIQKPDGGSQFEYVKDLRDADALDMNHSGVSAVLNGTTQPNVLSMEPGTLVLFRGRNSIHRVSPNESDKTRILAVLAYNTEPNIALSESARMTFYGRLG